MHSVFCISCRTILKCLRTCASSHASGDWPRMNLQQRRIFRNISMHVKPVEFTADTRLPNMTHPWRRVWGVHRYMQTALLSQIFHLTHSHALRKDARGHCPMVRCFSWSKPVQDVFLIGSCCRSRLITCW